jgi:hypothetical protein
MWLVTLWNTNEKALIKDTNELAEFLKVHQQVTVEWVNVWSPPVSDPLDNSPKHKTLIPLIPLSRSIDEEE